MIQFFIYLLTIILFVSSQDAYNLFSAKIITISKDNERNKIKKIKKNTLTGCLQSPSSQERNLEKEEA